MSEDTTTKIITLPVGRVINHSLFKKDQFNDKSVPSYKIELAFPKDSEEIADIEDLLLDFADAKWGAGAGDDEDLVLPLISGDKLAKKRSKKGKDGSAYEGMVVIRANTIYNKDGADGPGGVQVFDEDVEPVEPARQGEVYNGCYGQAAVVIGSYEDDDGNNALKFYLSAFQKTGDGEKLVKAADRSSLFNPVGREGGAKKRNRAGRRTR